MVGNLIRDLSQTYKEWKKNLSFFTLDYQWYMRSHGSQVVLLDVWWEHLSKRSTPEYQSRWRNTPRLKLAPRKSEPVWNNSGNSRKRFNSLSIHSDKYKPSYLSLKNKITKKRKTSSSSQIEKVHFWWLSNLEFWYPLKWQSCTIFDLLNPCWDSSMNLAGENEVHSSGSGDRQKGAHKASIMCTGALSYMFNLPCKVCRRASLANLLACSPNIWWIGPVCLLNLICHLSKSQLKPQNILFS